MLPLAFAAMEGVAYASHRWIMHGPLWVLHASHHRTKSEKDGPWEANDFFGFFFAAISMVLIALGWNGNAALIWAGAGMAAYGAAYFLLHDILSHGRFGLRLKPRGPYLRAILRSHRVHHARRGKEGCVSFGFLVPLSAAALRRERRKPMDYSGKDKPSRAAMLSE